LLLQVGDLFELNVKLRCQKVNGEATHFHWCKITIHKNKVFWKFYINTYRVENMRSYTCFILKAKAYSGALSEEQTPIHSTMDWGTGCGWEMTLEVQCMSNWTLSVFQIFWYVGTNSLYLQTPTSVHVYTSIYSIPCSLSEALSRWAPFFLRTS
jgi:hypothetical protein